MLSYLSHFGLRDERDGIATSPFFNNLFIYLSFIYHLFVYHLFIYHLIIYLFIIYLFIIYLFVIYYFYVLSLTCEKSRWMWERGLAHRLLTLFLW